jgi:hypothetical protein
MRAFLLLPVAAAVQVLETHQSTHAHVDYDGLKQTLKSIAAQRKDGTKIDGESEDQIRKILQTVETTLMDALGVEARNSQYDLDAAVQRIRDCDVERTGWFANDLLRFDEDIVHKRGVHANCRSQEVDDCRRRNNDCDEQDALVCQIDNEMCVTPNFANGDSGDVNHFMNCMSDLVCKNHQTYVDGRTACRTSCSRLSSKTASCHHFQELLEASSCSREVAVQNCCASYRMCREREEQSYYNTLREELQLQQVLQTQREALECLKCYGHAILENRTSLDHCESPPPCCELEGCPIIVCPEGADCEEAPPLIRIPCNEPAHFHPCDDAWLAREYVTEAGNWLAGEISRQRCDPCVAECQQDLCTVENNEGGFSLWVDSQTLTFSPLCQDSEGPVSEPM